MRFKERKREILGFWWIEIQASRIAVSKPASKLSYLGEWNESRENARASGEAARAQIGAACRRLPFQRGQRAVIIFLTEWRI